MPHPLPLLALLAAAPPASAAPPWAVTVSSLVKVRPSEHVEGGTEARLDAPRGGCAAFQLLARPPARNVEVEPPLLHGAHGTLGVTLYREGYLPVRTPSNSQGAPGLWPDPLLPVRGPGGERLTHVLPADSTPEEPLVLYAEACPPLDARPGTYRGAVVLRAEGKPLARVPVTLEVEPVSLPATSSLPNTFGLSLYTVAYGHRLDPESKEAAALLHAYAAELLRHRVTAQGLRYEPPPTTIVDGKAQLDFRHFDEEMGPFLSGTALPSGARFTTFQVVDNAKLKTDAERVLYYQAFRDHFQARHWPQVLFYYAKDEPKPEDRPLVLAQSSRVRKAGGISVLVTSALDRSLLPATDIFCPVLNCFFPRKGPATCAHVETAAALKRHIPASGHVWWYQSCMSHGCDGGPSDNPRQEAAYRGWASYMVDHPVPLNRAMGPLAYLTGVEGELYWDTVYGYEHEGKPWEDLFRFGGNGDGTLFYPGTPERLGSREHLPVASLRLKAIRDGLEDYELLRALERAGEKPFADAEVRKLVRSGYDITLDPGVWEKTRAELLARLRAHAASTEAAQGAP